jgi:hypothetical protein
MVLFSTVYCADVLRGEWDKSISVRGILKGTHSTLLCHHILSRLLFLFFFFNQSHVQLWISSLKRQIDVLCAISIISFDILNIKETVKLAHDFSTVLLACMNWSYSSDTFILNRVLLSHYMSQIESNELGAPCSALRYDSSSAEEPCDWCM